jgi:hypothetical protein
MIDDVAPLVSAGFAVHLLKERSKAPVHDGWSTLPVPTLADLRREYRDGLNVGLRLGEPSRVGGYYLHVLDLDIREGGDEARAALDALLPKWQSFPVVQSGSGGESRHVYFLTDRPFRSRKVRQSEDFVTVMQDGASKKKRAWEIELFGTGKQVAMPPSIHPSGQPYRWLTPFDLDMIDLGLGPVVPSETVAGWIDQKALVQISDDDAALIAAAAAEPVRIRSDKLDETLAALPLGRWCEDRDGWLKVGFALHHQFKGEQAGYDKWCEFSRQSNKFDDEIQRVTWDAMRGRPNPSTVRTLIRAANEVRQGATRQELAAIATISNASTDDTEHMATGFPTADVWTELLELTEDGAIKNSLHNIDIICHHDPRIVGLAQYNEFTGETVGRTRPIQTDKASRQLLGKTWDIKDPINGDLWTDKKDNQVRSILEAPRRLGGYGLKISDRDLTAAINNVAGNFAFHPVKEYLESLTWDGIPRCDTLFIDYLGATDDDYHRQVAGLTLMGAVTRVFEPGHKFDFVPIFEGFQGKRKSTFISILARTWFSELHGDFSDRKGMVEQMQGAWILELPELSTMQKAETQAIKAFVSAQSDKVRLAYGRRAEQFPRQCIMIGSTNEGQYLKDETGNRRFWPVRTNVTQIDTDRLKVEIDQIWAEVVFQYREMRKAQPTETLELYIRDSLVVKAAMMIQESRRIETPEDALSGKISHWLDKPQMVDDEIDGATAKPRNQTTLIEIWTDCMREPVARYDQRAAQTIGKAMRKLPNWTQFGGKTEVEGFGRQRVWHRIEDHITPVVQRAAATEDDELV